MGGGVAGFGDSTTGGGDSEVFSSVADSEEEVCLDLRVLGFTGMSFDLK